MFTVRVRVMIINFNNREFGFFLKRKKYGFDNGVRFIFWICYIRSCVLSG